MVSQPRVFSLVPRFPLMNNITKLVLTCKICLAHINEATTKLLENEVAVITACALVEDLKRRMYF